MRSSIGLVDLQKSMSLKLTNCLLVNSRANTIVVILFIKVFVIPLEFKGIGRARKAFEF